jgi:IS5 family transposase
MSGDKAIITAHENEVQKIVDYFKRWLPNVNQIYKNKVLREKELEEEAKRQQLEREIKQQEARQRVLKNVKI